jgi:hypothetical protein
LPLEFFILFYHFYIYLHTYTLFRPPPPFHLSLPYASRQNLFLPLILQLCGRENIRDNKKDIVWDKDSYTERFLVLLSCICVLQPILVHLYQTSSLLPGPLLTVASASLRLLYSLLYNEHINHIHVFKFPSLSLFLLCMFSP